MDRHYFGYMLRLGFNVRAPSDPSPLLLLSSALHSSVHPLVHSVVRRRRRRRRRRTAFRETSPAAPMTLQDTSRDEDSLSLSDAGISGCCCREWIREWTGGRVDERMDAWVKWRWIGLSVCVCACMCVCLCFLFVQKF